MLLEKNPKSEERRKQKKLREKHTDRLQRVIHVKFKNKSLLQRAVTHRSYVN